MRIVNFLVLVFSFFTLNFYSQCPYLGPDQYLPCGIGSTTLTADLSQCGPGSNPNGTSNYNVIQIPYVAQNNTGTLVQLSDDSQSGIFNIGFTFCYFGSIYTQFRIGSNGWVSLGAGAQPTTFTSASIPNVGATIPKNCIMGPWQDWNPGIGGQIRYQVQGVAPCRKLVVSWIGVPMFSCTNVQGTFHIVLYESTNYIENHIQTKPNCLVWANGTAVQGVHNLTGTLAITTPGRNSTQWTALNDARRWEPSGPTITPTLTWYQVGNPVSIGTGPTITVTPPAQGANYTCHLEYPSCNAGWTTCNQQAGLGPDTVFVQPGPPNLNPPVVAITNPTCNGSCDGSILVTPTNGTGPFTISWNNASGLNPTGLCQGTYNYLLTDVNGCTINGVANLVDPPLVVTGPIVYNDTVCFGSINEFYSVPLNVNYTYNWTSNGIITSGQGTNNISVDWSSVQAGFISNAVSVIASDQSGCTSQQISINLFVLNIIPSIDSIGPFCSYDECVTLTANPQGGIFSNGSQFCPQTSSLNNQVYYTYVQSGCTFIDSINIIVNPQPFITSIFPNDEFYELCTGDSIVQSYLATSNFNGTTIWEIQGDTLQGSSINYTWTQDGIYIISAYQIVNECISPIAQTTITIDQCPEDLLYIPNAFTPDGDENNPVWKFSYGGKTMTDFNLYLFNRWGEVIWECHDVNGYWDGTYGGNKVQDGVYVWRLEYKIEEFPIRSKFGHVVVLN